jgi:lipid kinase YegS
MWLRIILNRKAAQDEDLRAAIRNMRASGHRVEARAMWEPGDGVWMATQAAHDGCDAVIAAGGDGTINEVINGLMAHPAPPPLGVVPMGTANDFAAMLGLPMGAPAAALERIAYAVPRPVDVGLANDRYFINVASAGFGAQVTASTSPDFKDMLGGIAYLLTGLASMVDVEPAEVSLRAPGLTWEGPILALCVGNGRQAGGGFQVCPEAEVDDGLFDVLIVQDFSLEEAPGILHDILRFGLRGPHLPTQITTLRTPWLEVEAEAPGLHVNLDGEPTRGRRFSFRVVPAALSLLAGTPARPDDL